MAATRCGEAAAPPSAVGVLWWGKEAAALAERFLGGAVDALFSGVGQPSVLHNATIFRWNICMLLSPMYCGRRGKEKEGC